MSINIIQEEKDLEKYFYVTYELGSDISVYRSEEQRVLFRSFRYNYGLSII